MEIDNRKKVFVMIGDGFTLEKVKDEIKSEGYKYDFHFDNMTYAMLEADEIWVFGNCVYKEQYKQAVRLGKDIWVMG